MLSLLHLHPIFEFFLTVYFGFVIAPEFLGNFLFRKVPLYVRASRDKVIERLSRYIQTLEFWEQKFENEKSAFKRSAYGLSIEQDYLPIYMPSIISTKQSINDLISRIENETAEIVKAKANSDKDSIKSEISKACRSC